MLSNLFVQDIWEKVYYVLRLFHLQSWLWESTSIMWAILIIKHKLIMSSHIAKTDTLNILQKPILSYLHFFSFEDPQKLKDFFWKNSPFENG